GQDTGNVRRPIPFRSGERHWKIPRAGLFPLMLSFGVMAGRGYSVFDTTVGRCGIAWGHAGVIGVHLPEAREIETRRRMLRQHPDARELRPPPEIETAIDGIVALLRGEVADLGDVT